MVHSTVDNYRYSRLYTYLMALGREPLDSIDGRRLISALGPSPDVTTLSAVLSCRERGELQCYAHSTCQAQISSNL